MDDKKLGKVVDRLGELLEAVAPLEAEIAKLQKQLNAHAERLGRIEGEAFFAKAAPRVTSTYDSGRIAKLLKTKVKILECSKFLVSKMEAHLSRAQIEDCVAERRVSYSFGHPKRLRTAQQIARPRSTVKTGAKGSRRVLVKKR